MKLHFTAVIAAAFALSACTQTFAAFVFVTDSVGNIWRYESIADMAAQTSSNITGDKVRDVLIHGNAYATDQDATMDLSSGLIYRITGTGDVIRYSNMADYVFNQNPFTAATAVFTGTKAVNGLSYDGVGTRFYSIIASGTNAGDIAIYNNVTRVLAANQNSFMTAAGYVGATLNFYDPDGMSGTTVGNPPTLPQKSIDAKFFQVASNGRLEGFESIADYNSSSNNRINASALNAFGGTSTFKAIAAFSVPADLAAIPEAASGLVWLVGSCLWFAVRRR